MAAMSQPLSERLRQVLRDFRALAGARARLEAATESEFRQRSEAVERVWQSEQKRIDKAHTEGTAAAQEQAARTRARIEAQLRDEDQRARAEYERAKKEALHGYAVARENTEAEFKEARWTIGTLYEAGKKVARDQLQEAQLRAKNAIEALQEQQQQALAQLQEWHLANALPLFNQLSQAANAEDPWAALDACNAQGTNALERLRALRLPRYVKGSRPYVFLVVLWILASLPAIFLQEWYYWLLATTVTVFPIGLLINWWLGVRARTVAVYLWSALNQALVDARHLRGRCLDLAKENYRAQKNDNKRRHQQSLNEAAALAKRKLQKARQTRTEALRQALGTLKPLLKQLSERRQRELEQVERQLKERLEHLNSTAEAGLFEASERFRSERDESNRKHADEWTRLVGAWKQGTARFLAEVRAIEREGRRSFAPWADPSWQNWRPPADIPQGLPLGVLDVRPEHIPDAMPREPHLQRLDMTGVVFPALLPFPASASVLFAAQDEGKEVAVRALQNLLLRAWTALPPGKIRCTIFDPVGRGENFAAFMHLADSDEALVNSRIWTEQAHIEQRLADLTAHMENVLQKYLRNQYETLAEYNAQAGEVAEPFRFLVVADFPVNFSPDAARRLISLASSGARCGLYVFVMVDMKQPLPQGIDLADLERACIVLDWKKDRFVWADEDFGGFPLLLEQPPDGDTITRLLRIAGEESKRASKVEVPFDFIAPPRADWWREDSRAGITLPLGRAGATGRQQLALGQGTSQHVLIAGKTGSGKSTLLHVLIAQAAMRYSPSEIELYLVDFKKGVEFKTYATHALPHARVVAVESEREFGLSVLQRLDAELVRRGELFRQAGVNDLPSYRTLKDRTPGNGQTGANQALPRVLLVVDEFQEFFVEDDKVAQEAALLLDRLVRQGRAFGIHVLLGSQTLGGAYSLARSTIDQMAVRIALQCSETDAHLILSKDNSEARLLARPGEAIYNAAGGALEGNNFFQIVWLDDERRDTLLSEVVRLAREWRTRTPELPTQPQIVFEGTAPSEISANPLLEQALQHPAYGGPAAPVTAWLGEAVAIKDPTSAVFRRQSGSNLLLVGQQDEAAFSIAVAALTALSAQLPPPDNGSPYLHFVVANPLGRDAERLFQRLPDMLPVKVVLQRDLPALLTQFTEEVEARLKGERQGPPLFLFLHGLQRLRDLRRPDDDFGFARKGEAPTPFKLFTNLLRDGPPHGVHTVVWCDTLANLQRTFDRQTLREFEMRVLFQMSANDSSTLMDAPTAARLGAHRALYYTEDQGKLEKFRPYGLPNPDWLWTAVRSGAASVPSS